MNNEIMHSVNASDAGPDRWWQQVLAFGCLPDTQVQTDTPPSAAAPAAFIVMP